MPLNLLQSLFSRIGVFSSLAPNTVFKDWSAFGGLLGSLAYRYHHFEHRDVLTRDVSSPKGLDTS